MGFCHTFLFFHHRGGVARRGVGEAQLTINMLGSATAIATVDPNIVTVAEPVKEETW